MIEIRAAERSDIPALYALYNTIGKKDDGYFEHLFDETTPVYIAFLEDMAAGFCIYNLVPRYHLYRRMNIPEIQDLNVRPEARRRGVATALIKWCEGVARAQGKDMIGISVGLTHAYGPAQILYASLGFIPDGNGVTYDRAPVEHGARYPVDDDLALMLLKAL